jgi:hypothetical protein
MFSAWLILCVYVCVWEREREREREKERDRVCVGARVCPLFGYWKRANAQYLNSVVKYSDDLDIYIFSRITDCHLWHTARSSEGLEMYSYLLTPWSRVLLEKLTSFTASQEIPRIYGTRKFITVFKSVRHLSLSWARSIQFPQSPSTSSRSLPILSSHLRLGLPNGLFPSGFPTNTLCTPLRNVFYIF